MGLRTPPLMDFPRISWSAVSSVGWYQIGRGGSMPIGAHRGPGAPLAQALRKHRESSVQTDWPSIVKMLVQLPVLGVALFVANPGRFSMRRAEVGLPGTCRAYRAQRDLLFQVAAMAGGAFRGGRRRQDQVLETVSAFAACVFVDWHERSLSFHAGVNDPQCCCRLAVSSLLELPPFGVH